MRRFALSPLMSLALSLLATLTMWAVLVSWQVFSLRDDFLVPLLLLALLVGVVGGLLRALFTRAVWAALATALLTVTLVYFTVGGMGGTAGSSQDFISALEAARTSAQTYVAPVPDTVPSIGPLLVIGGALVIFAFDLFVSTLRQVVLGGLFLLAAATVPVAVTGQRMSWWLFALIGVGYLALLYGYQMVHLQRWGRGTDRQGMPGPVASSAGRGEPGGEQKARVLGMGLGVGAVGLSVAVLVPTAIGLPSSGLLGGGSWGSLGSGDSGGQIEVTSPVVDMRRDLKRAEDRPVLELTTDDPAPSYLRLGTLNSFNGSAWTPGDREVTWSANGAFPAIPGVADSLPRKRYSYQAHALSVLRSDWLPTMALTTSAETTEAWTVDPATLDVFHGGDDEATTSDLTYAFASVELDLDPQVLGAATSGAREVDPQFLALPAQMPPVVEDLATEVTRGERTPFDKAVALQNWFRSGGGFEYSLERAPVGAGNGTLETFLDQRIGYCEQYSSAMAVMARELGIPSRVAVGWLTPEQTGNDRYVFSSHDAHAWTELYIKGAGWVAFEPTPSTRASRVPEYTENGGATPSPSPSASSSTSTSPSPVTSPSASTSTSSSASPSASATTTQSSSDDQGSSLPLMRILLVLLGVSAAVLLGMTPRLLRGLRARRRRRTGDPEEAWRELLDTSRDLGLEPPGGRSLRETGAWFLQRLAAPSTTRSGAALETGPAQAPAAAQQIEQLVHSLESRRYAPVGAPGTDGSPAWQWPDQALTALSLGVSASARSRAVWWPRSLFSRE